ncbi:hypothetical protein Y261_15140, partial [Listeria monocytogenes]|nr:hypothetical protein [Listeria monocytogenes]
KDRKYIKKVNKNINYNLVDINVVDNLVENLSMCLNGNKNELGQLEILLIELENLKITSIYLTPDPTCPMCNKLPVDSEGLIKKEFESDQFSLNSFDFIPQRLKSRSFLKDRVLKIGLNKYIGIFNTLLDNFESPFPVAVANLPLENGIDEVGVGRTTTIENSRSVALLEGFERYAGMRPRGKKTGVYDFFYNLNEDVIELKKLILHENSISIGTVYENTNFKFNINMKYHWVFAYNVTEKKSLLIPETYAYYGMTMLNESYKKEIFVYEISNGCSVGSSLLEASYYGLLEVIERDAFLTAWYINRGIKKIILDDEYLKMHPDLNETINIFTKYYEDFDLSFYEISNDTKLPVILATVLAKKIDKYEMNFMCAASANSDISKAIKNSLQEISGIFFGLQKKFIENFENICYLVENLSEVKTMEEHSLVYGHFKNLDKIVFFNQVDEMIEASDLEKKNACLNKSLNLQFQSLIDDLKIIKKDVIVVNQTTAEMKKIGINCVKIIVPGLLPMTFGAKNVRVSKNRVKEIETFEKRKLNIQLSPHPFP